MGSDRLVQGIAWRLKLHLEEEPRMAWCRTPKGGGEEEQGGGGEEEERQ